VVPAPSGAARRGGGAARRGALPADADLLEAVLLEADLLEAALAPAFFGAFVTDLEGGLVCLDLLDFVAVAIVCSI
jgi:hypothetical protein